MRGWIARLSYERQILIVYILAVFITVIDGTMVNVALPTMADDFGVAANEAEWVAVGYLLAVAAVIPAAGWLGDRFGSKRVFVSALAWFTAWSVVCGLAQTLDQLVAFRVAQGLGGGVLVPIGSAIVFRAFPLERRATAASAVLSVAVMGPALGPLLGGLLVDNLSWHWIFFINLPIGTAGVLFAAAVLREERDADAGSLDLAGLILSAGSVSVLVYTLSIGPERGWTSPTVIGLGVVGVVALAAMIRVETRRPRPMLALRLYADHHFRIVNISSSMLYAGFFGQILVLPIYLQSLRGYSASTSGMIASTTPLGIFIVSNVFGRRSYDRYGPRSLMTFAGLAGGLISCSYVFVGLDTPLVVLAAMGFARGVAMGFVFIAIQTSVYATVSIADTARATSVFNTQRQVAYAAGAALGATVLTSGLQDLSESAPAIDRLPPYQWAFLAVGLVMLPAVATSRRIRDDDVAATRTPVAATSGDR
ncbi:MAG: DHA2 family efflux MFS transporter permease subunit [Ilumatobacteraceae bacterium]